MTISKETVQKELEAMGIDPTNPQVLSPWGFKVVEVEGRKWLQAMSPDEYREAVRKELGRELTSEELQNPRCFRSAGGGCVAAGGCSHCTEIWSAGQLWCVCGS